MKRTWTAVAVLAAAAVMLAAVASARPSTARQRIAIQLTGGTSQSFALTPMVSGAVSSDTGRATFCCWSSHYIVRDGQSVELNDPQMTLTGKRGTLVLRNRIEWVDLPDGWAAFTGTWTVVRGTGDYAGLSGGGRGAGIQLANGNAKSRFEGFLSPR